ncbi:MAG: hypothetical protein JNM31_06405 [Flavobacteriales bacterium]|nr:hypothetical protein [Flavobacteriales bacterium]
MSTERDLPLSTVTLVFGVLSIPLAFLAQLCVPALIMALLALAFHAWGRKRSARKGGYTAVSLTRSQKGYRLALVGACLSTLMWILWASNVLLS